jgi:hypothetical protein
MAKNKMTLDSVSKQNHIGRIVLLVVCLLSLGAKSIYDFIGAIDDVLRFLPRPAIIYFLYFWVLWFVTSVGRSFKGLFWSVSLWFSTYLIIYLRVGHNAKAHAIAYMPMVMLDLF